jgi:hypothetical protein
MSTKEPTTYTISRAKKEKNEKEICIALLAAAERRIQ